MAHQLALNSEADTAEFGARLVRRLGPGAIVLLSGPLGAGKTTLARAMLRELGWKGAVRSPTFNLLHAYPTDPPLLHADLYRVESAEGIGLEEYLDTHLCVIEWPDRLRGSLDGREGVVRIDLAFAGGGRLVTES